MKEELGREEGASREGGGRKWGGGGEGVREVED